MDIFSIIRGTIILIPGLALIFCPKKVKNFQNHLLKLLSAKMRIKNINNHPKTGIVFVLVSLIFFAYGLIN